MACFPEREGFDFAWQLGKAMAKSSNVANIGFKGDAIIYAGVNNLIKKTSWHSLRYIISLERDMLKMLCYILGGATGIYSPRFCKSVVPNYID